jgi:hypothetical protein
VREPPSRSAERQAGIQPIVLHMPLHSHPHSP